MPSSNNGSQVERLNLGHFVLDQLNNSSWLWIGAISLTLLYLMFSQPSAQPFDTTTKSPFPTLGVSSRLAWFFPALRARLTSYVYSHLWIQDGYQRFSKQGEPFMVYMPDYDLTILPLQYLNEVKNASEDDIVDNNRSAFLVEHTMNPGIKRNQYHLKIIKKDLTYKTSNSVSEIAEEIDVSMQKYMKAIAGKLPDEHEYTRLCMYQVILKVVARTSTRMFVGYPLCHNEEYLDAILAYVMFLFPTVEIMKVIPNILRPLMFPIILYPLRRYWNTARKHLEPIIAQRMQDIRDGLAQSEQPDDLLQNYMRAAPFQEKEENTPEYIAGRIIISSLAAIHTTTIAATHCLYDLAVLPPHVTTTLREEVSRMISHQHSHLVVTKQSFQSLPQTDAFLKESARLNMTAATTLRREVSNPNGWTTRDGKLWFPFGSVFAFPNRAFHQDDEVYKCAKRFDYTRFLPGNEKGQDRLMVTLSDEYFVFGLGKHACPGRFFAHNELRILLSYLLVHYDIKPMESRPKDMWVRENMVCNMDAKVGLRRRRLGKQDGAACADV